MDEKKFLISPQTKVSELITIYPELEEVLFDLSPAFRKLKNPVLKKTVARVTTLQQAAKVGNINVNDLINHLRKEVGQEISGFQEEKMNSDANKPIWLIQKKVVKTLDVRKLIDCNENPLPLILSETRKLKTNQILKLITSFIPAPVIDKLKDKGFEFFTQKVTENEIHTFFINPEQNKKSI
ncbi:DUF1858 domain-containing protein [Bacteroidota bacterium]